MFKSKIVRGKFFYANPIPVKRMRLNHFLKVDVPTDADVAKLREGFQNFEKLVVNGSVDFTSVNPVGEEVVQIADFLNSHSELAPIDRSLVALHQFKQKTEMPMFFEEAPVASFDGEFNHVDIFTPLRINSHLEGLIITDQLDKFKSAILNRSDCRDQIEYLQRLCGKSGQQAMNIALEVVGDMERGTHYPPQYRPTSNGPELANLIGNMMDKIVLKKKEAEAKKE